ncbi:MAG: hypothetical protein H5T92_05645 [Synergistales bacterium]|nr:hypothetical protein [Synergistales bacterium]
MIARVLPVSIVLATLTALALIRNYAWCDVKGNENGPLDTIGWDSLTGLSESGPITETYGVRDLAQATDHVHSQPPKKNADYLRLVSDGYLDQISPTAVEKVRAAYPILSSEAARFEIARMCILLRAGNIYSSILRDCSPPAKEIILNSGTTLEDLSQKHLQLCAKVVRSYLGSCGGAVIRAVHERLVGRYVALSGATGAVSPASLVYDDLMNGRPLRIDSPSQLINILSGSGLSGDVAAILCTQRETNERYLTPSAIISLRCTQYFVDWAPRIGAISRAWDPILREGFIDSMAAQAGYKDSRELMALHSPAVTSELVRLWQQAGAQVQNSNDLQNISCDRNVLALAVYYLLAMKGLH